jgi:small subunit ribosomal protein S19
MSDGIVLMYYGIGHGYMVSRIKKTYGYMTRSQWKGPYTQVHVEETCIWSRASTITPQWVGRRVSIHNGKHFVGLSITQDMVGHKFGEFASTRKQAKHRHTTR